MSTKKTITAILAILLILLIGYIINQRFFDNEKMVLAGEVQQCDTSNTNVVLAILESDHEDHDPYVVTEAVMKTHGITIGETDLGSFYNIFIKKNKITDIEKTSTPDAANSHDKEVYDNLNMVRLHDNCQLDESAGFHTRRHIIIVGSSNSSTLGFTADSTGTYKLYKTNDEVQPEKHYLFNQALHNKYQDYDSNGAITEGLWITESNDSFQTTLDNVTVNVINVIEISNEHEHREFKK